MAEDLPFPALADTGRCSQLLRKVSIRNYKSIGSCSVALQPLTVLVGRNGAGKSNFLDALRFVVDGLQTSLDHAIKSRGGIKSVRRHSTGHPRNLSIQLEFNLPDGRRALYGFELAARIEGGFVVKWERLEVLSDAGQRDAWYSVEDGELKRSSLGVSPKSVADRLYLVSASGTPEFRPAYDALTAMGFYSLNPEVMKELQSPDAGELLHRDGGNIASVIARLQTESPDVKDRAQTYLESIVAGVEGVERAALGPRETIEFRQRVLGAKAPWSFYASSMSDGTLRVLGVLVAISQAHLKDRIRVVGIEEPEAALHPAAARALMNAISEAAQSTQVIITTHSADLLESPELDARGLLAVECRDGQTFIAELDAASRDAIRDHLYSAGELLRMDQLAPDNDDLSRQVAEPSLFDGVES